MYTYEKHEHLRTSANTSCNTIICNTLNTLCYMMYPLYTVYIAIFVMHTCKYAQLLLHSAFKFGKYGYLIGLTVNSGTNLKLKFYNITSKLMTGYWFTD